MHNDSMMQQAKMVTGRVTKNLLGVFAGGNRETLEVKLRLSIASRPNRHGRQNSFDMQPQQLQQQAGRPMETAMTPTGTAEWNNFIQSNPQIGQMGQVSRVASPALSQGPPSMMNRRDSFGPGSQMSMPGQEVLRIAPMPVGPGEQPEATGASSRPSSRASNRAPRRKPPTGRPRGRPRKKPLEGNTSGYEDGTEGEDGPAKKRAKTTKVDKASNPFAADPESLRVAASTSGSLRNFRPVAANTDSGASNNSHLQEVPRAPTPVPDGPLGPPGRAGIGPGKLRRESTLSYQAFSNQSSFTESRQPLSPGHEDGRSPDSIAPTPMYSEGSPADIGSSPPVARATPFIRSSPPPSSPILPPMPNPENSFAIDETDDLFGEETQQLVASLPKQTFKPVYPVPRKPTEARNASGVPVQVFQMQNGPSGQDLVHICSYNTPQLGSAPAVPSDTQSLPPLKQDTGRQPPKKKAQSPPGMAPTPPPTTDAPEKTASPGLAREDSADGAVQNGSVSSSTSESSGLQNHLGIATVIAQPPRQLLRSQSAGPLALPAMPASEPAGPSSLSQSITNEPERPHNPPAPSANLKRSASTGPLTLPIPASDPVVPMAAPSIVGRPETAVAKSDAFPLPSSPPTRSNKNFVKKHAIKQRLEEAIMNGEMPPYCSNCGAIETPTWRKIWVQDREGVPEYCEYSEKPGRVTAIEIVRRDADDKPTSYRMIKKSLGVDDDKSKWQELLLCNPCGIWLTKCKCHRPRDRWDKDASRLGQERRKRGTGRSTSRPKKARGRGDGLMNPTSEAYMHTDALGPIEPSSPKMTDDAEIMRPESQQDPGMGKDNLETGSNPGSAHSGGSGIVKSPIEVEFDEAVGATKRILFPSPRKDVVTKTLCELDVNIVQTPTDDAQRSKASGEGKENMAARSGQVEDVDDLDTLFKSPAVARPSTPPPNAKPSTSAEPFKTPTRPTPTHRPITRSISRSLKSVRSVRSIASPGQQVLLQRTPTKTPRLAFGLQGPGTVRRSPRNHQGGFEVFDTPISRTISQMFSEPCGFGDNDLDLSSLPALDGNHGGLIDFGNLLSTDGAIPSSPPKDGSLGFDYHGSANVWAHWDIEDAGSMDTN